MGEMMGKSKILSDLAVKQITRRGFNHVGGVTGLGLNVTKSDSRNWVLRYQVGKKRRDMGLGGYPDISLRDARELAKAARLKLAQGVDPIDAARTRKAEALAEKTSAITFGRAAELCIEAREPEWKSAKHAQQWRNTLQTYAEPRLGQLLVRDVGVPHVLSVLEPIWREKPETASRLRGRIESVLDWAIARGYRDQPNPARWKGHLDSILATPSKFAKRTHHRAVPYKDVKQFMRALKGQAGVGARALEFLILTAARSGEVRGATWAEFDLDNALWTVPKERMKAGKEHRVPLSVRAVKLVKEQEALRHCDYVFGSPRGGQLSDMTLSAVLRRMEVDAVPHGFRSTFRDWSSEVSDFPNEVAEMALAHVIPSRVEAAYRRGDLLDKRREMMDAWAKYVG